MFLGDGADLAVSLLDCRVQLAGLRREFLFVQLTNGVTQLEQIQQLVGTGLALVDLVQLGLEIGNDAFDVDHEWHDLVGNLRGLHLVFETDPLDDGFGEFPRLGLGFLDEAPNTGVLFDHLVE